MCLQPKLVDLPGQSSSHSDLSKPSDSGSTVLLFPFVTDVLLGIDSVFPFLPPEEEVIVPSAGRTYDPEDEADTCRRSLLPSFQRIIPDFKAGRMRLSMSVREPL